MPRARNPQVIPVPGNPPGAANRTDLPPQPIVAAPGGPYGSRKASEDAQRALPLPDAAAAQQMSAPPPSYAPVPTEPFSLTSPSMRPDEPVTAMPDPTRFVGRGPQAAPASMEQLALDPDVGDDFRAMMNAAIMIRTQQP